MNIPVAIPFLGREEEEAAVRAIRSGWVTQGPLVKEFEDRFAEYVGAKYAVATTSCTTALHAALAVSGIGPGDEVIVPSLSFIATANAVVHCGAKPVFVDIDSATCNMDPRQIEAVITKKAKAVMPVHQMGLPAELDAIKAITDKHGLLLIEDAACAIGSTYKGKKIGGHGNTACFSFHPRKIITTGEGGMITTDDADLVARLRRFRHHGMSVSDMERHKANKVIIEEYPEIGYNYRMTDIQAAIGIEQMKKLDLIIEKRRAIASSYDEQLSTIPGIRLLHVPDHIYHNYQSYWIEVTEASAVSRDQLMAKLLEKGISTRRGIMAIHREQCYASYAVSLPVTEQMTKHTMLLALYPSLREEEVEYVTRCMRELLTPDREGASA